MFKCVYKISKIKIAAMQQALIRITLYQYMARD